MKKKNPFFIFTTLLLSICLILGGTCSCKENSTVKNIMFIGNSLTYVGDIPSKVVSLAKDAGKTIDIIQKTNGGYKLSQHLDDLKSGQYDEDIKKADAVVLQEYGSYGNDTANSVDKILKLFKPGTRFYFLLTDFDIPRRLTELKDVSNITYIPSGYAHNLLLNDGYIYEDLHATGDYHPNELYGYIGALTVYSVVFQASCLGSSYDFLNLNAKSLIFGLTKEEKDQSVKKIQETVMKAVNAKQADYVISTDGNSSSKNTSVCSQIKKPALLIEDIPETYTIKMAIENGDYVILDDKIENSEVMDDFLEKFSHRENAFIRKTTITSTGDVTITDITYENRSFLVVTDTTRQKSGLPTIETNKYARMLKYSDGGNDAYILTDQLEIIKTQYDKWQNSKFNNGVGYMLLMVKT